MLSMKSARKIDSSGQEDSDIDITPMLDVVFIMLIFFIVTASFVKESGFGINTPTGDSPNTPTVSPIVLEISAIDEVRIQKQLVLQSAIRPTVVRLRAENPDAPVVVRLHPEVTTKAMVSAIDEIRSAQVPLPSVSLIKI